MQPMTPLRSLLCTALLAAQVSAQDEPEPELPAWTWFPGAVWSVNGIAYDSRNSKHSGFETETASLLLDGLHEGGFRLHVDVDLDGEDTRSNLWEAWGEWPLGPRSWVRVGQMRVPLGSSFATKEEDHSLVGYAFPPYLAGRHDVGAMLDGYLAPDTWSSVAATFGRGFDLDGRNLSSKQLAVRLQQTAASDGDGAFEGPYVGLSLAWSPEYDDPIQLDTPLEQTVFTTRDLDGGDAFWQHLEFGWRANRLRASAELTHGAVNDIPVGGGREVDADQLTSWAAEVVFSLRGEAARWQRGAWVPARGPLGSRPTPDAQGEVPELPIELAVRYSNADIDRVLFDEGITTYNPSTQEVRTFSAAVGGLVTPDTGLTLQWVKVIADDDLRVFGGHNRDSSWVLRFDHRFGRPPPQR